MCSEEACADLRAAPPDFDACTVPLVLWTRWPYNLAEAFATVYARLLRAVAEGDVARPGEVLPVLATPHGLQAPRCVVHKGGGTRQGRVTCNVLLTSVGVQQPRRRHSEKKLPKARVSLLLRLWLPSYLSYMSLMPKPLVRHLRRQHPQSREFPPSPLLPLPTISSHMMT